MKKIRLAVMILLIGTIWLFSGCSLLIKQKTAALRAVWQITKLNGETFPKRKNGTMMNMYIYFADDGTYYTAIKMSGNTKSEQNVFVQPHFDNSSGSYALLVTGIKMELTDNIPIPFTVTETELNIGSIKTSFILKAKKAIDINGNDIKNAIRNTLATQ